MLYSQSLAGHTGRKLLSLRVEMEEKISMNRDDQDEISQLMDEGFNVRILNHQRD